MNLFLPSLFQQKVLISVLMLSNWADITICTSEAAVRVFKYRFVDLFGIYSLLYAQTPFLAQILIYTKKVFDCGANV